jgi:hypothetical protein
MAVVVAVHALYVNRRSRLGAFTQLKSSRTPLPLPPLLQLPQPAQHLPPHHGRRAGDRALRVMAADMMLAAS